MDRDGTAVLARHAVVAGLIGCLHVALMASSFWVFWPHLVTEVTFGWVFGEQFVKWFPFELLAYVACLGFWRWRLITRGASRETQPLLVPTESGAVRLLPAEIEWLRAADNYVIVYGAAHPGGLKLRATLRDTLARLDGARFVRVHRSAAVNLDAVTGIDGSRVVLGSGARAPLSRRNRSLRHKIRIQ